VETEEQCDDGNTVLFDGCTDSCAVETGFACFGTPSTCYPVCGDGIVIPPEECDDGSVADGDGCSSVCTLEFAAAPAESSASSSRSFSSFAFVDTTLCGNGLTEPWEACDDGNLFDGDGCDHVCAVEILSSSASSVSSVSSAFSASSVLSMPSVPQAQSTSPSWWMWLLIVLIMLLLAVIVNQWRRGRRRNQEG